MLDVFTNEGGEFGRCIAHGRSALARQLFA
jgi:hypothetical protein